MIANLLFRPLNQLQRVGIDHQAVHDPQLEKIALTFLGVTSIVLLSICGNMWEHVGTISLV